MCFKRLSHGVNEHIIRDENELDRIREYIFNNPLNWKSDDENPMSERQSWMSIESSSIVQRVWNYCNVLCDDGVSYGD